jgi:hypothetical protein
MREYSRQLLEARDTLRAARERCALLSSLTGADPRAIWEWGSIERVSTRLLALRVGSEKVGGDMLAVAEALVSFDWADAEDIPPPRPAVAGERWSSGPRGECRAAVSEGGRSVEREYARRVARELLRGLVALRRSRSSQTPIDVLHRLPRRRGRRDVNRASNEGRTWD